MGLIQRTSLFLLGSTGAYGLAVGLAGTPQPARELTAVATVAAGRAGPPIRPIRAATPHSAWGPPLAPAPAGTTRQVELHAQEAGKVKSTLV